MQITDILLDILDVRPALCEALWYTNPRPKGLLSPNGLFYLVAVKDNDIPAIQRRMRQQYGFHSKASDAPRATFVACSIRTTLHRLYYNEEPGASISTLCDSVAPPRDGFLAMRFRSL